MSEPKWTPGPWEYAADKRGTGRVFAGSHEIVKAMASHGQRRLGFRERTANNHLIAAAPELFEALEALLAQAILHDLEDESHACETAIRTAEAAIAKAKGEQS